MMDEITAADDVRQEQRTPSVAQGWRSTVIITEIKLRTKSGVEIEVARELGSPNGATIQEEWGIQIVMREVGGFRFRVPWFPLGDGRPLWALSMDAAIQVAQHLHPEPGPDQTAVMDATYHAILEVWGEV